MKALVTGGAGFIGSNLVSALIEKGHEVVVLDDLSTGFVENVPKEAEMISGRMEDADAVVRAVKGAQLVFHLAASRAVARSVDDPLGTDAANTHGTLSLLVAARDAGVRRVVLASSSSVYGGAAVVPTPEHAELRPRSPYAVSKLAGEHYARVFWELYGLETVALRYFNVFGPRQRPDSAYAAVIPLFIEALSQGKPPEVHGDGTQTRDFTYISDVIRANILAAEASSERVAGRVFNIAQGGQTSLLRLLEMLGKVLSVTPQPRFTPPRAGDVSHSQADVRAAARDLGFSPEIDLEEGLRRTVSWFAAGVIG